LNRLPVVAITKETLLIVWQKRLVLLRALAGAALALAVLDTAMRHGLRGVGSVALVLLFTVLYVALSWALFTLFAVTCHRIVLIGETSVPKYGLRSWTDRETRFFGWILVSFFYALLVLGPILLAMFLLVFLTDFVDKGQVKYWIILGTILAAVPVMYVVARLAVLFPATAIGEHHNTDWAFETTAKNGWRIVAAGLVTVPFSLGMHALPVDHSLLSDFLMRLVDSAFLAVEIVALSLSFRFLSPIRPGEGGRIAQSRGAPRKRDVPRRERRFEAALLDRPRGPAAN
jgi:hypothetical protein